MVLKFGLKLKVKLLLLNRRRIMSSLYGATTLTPTKEQLRARDRKVREAIAYLGSKYLLAKSVEKINGGNKS